MKDEDEEKVAETYIAALKEKSFTVLRFRIERQGSLVHHVATATSEDGREIEAKGDSRLNALRALNVVTKAQ